MPMITKDIIIISKVLFLNNPKAAPVLVVVVKNNFVIWSRNIINKEIR